MGRKGKRFGSADVTLLDRVLDSGARRVAVVGLHPGAGGRTVLASLVRQLHRRELRYGVTSFPRHHIEDETLADPTTTIALPAGTSVASGATATTGDDVELELIEATRFEGPLGAVGLYRLVRGGEIELCGPAEPDEMGATLSRLADVAEGLALVNGTWGRRGFAAPGVTDGIVLALGAGYSATPERSAAAARYLVEIFAAPQAARPERLAWDEAGRENAAMLLDEQGARVGTLSLAADNPLPALQGADGRVAAVVLPQVLNDELLAPLVRAQIACKVVVRDATRINVAPVYLKAWQKLGGTVEVIWPAQVVAVATNPVNQKGRDADAAQFRDLVRETLPQVPVHDVALDGSGRARRPIWKFWE